MDTLQSYDNDNITFITVICIYLSEVSKLLSQVSRMKLLFFHNGNDSHTFNNNKLVNVQAHIIN